MMNLYIIRYGEIWLKGLNRKFFDDKLVRSIKLQAKAKIKKMHNRIIATSDKDIEDKLKTVFGIQSFSKALIVEKDFEKIKEAAFEGAKQRNFKTFRITCKREDKKFPMNSNDIARLVGEKIFEELHKKVDLKKPELNIGIEISDRAYLYFENIRGLGGLPVGSSGAVIARLETKEDVVAAWLMMKRGCAIFAMGEKDLGRLQKFHPYKLKSINISMKELDKYAEDNNIVAFVVGDLFEDMKDYKTNLTVLSPLVGKTDKEINEIYERIK